jgi:hypothetical protein
MEARTGKIVAQMSEGSGDFMGPEAERRNINGKPITRSRRSSSLDGGGKE